MLRRTAISRRRAGPRQQQVRDIRARDRQDQPHHAPAIYTEVASTAAAAYPGRLAPSLTSRSEDSPAPDRWRPWSPPIGETTAQCGLRLREAHAGAQPGHDFEPIVVLVEIPWRPASCLSAAAGDWCATEDRIPALPRIDAEESRRSHSRYGERDVVDEDGLADRAGRVAESPFAECVAQYGDRRCAHAIVVRNNQAARSGCDSEARKIIAGDELAAGLFGLAL